MTYPQLSKEVAPNEIEAEMITNRGTIRIKLFPEIAPKTVENFVTHSKNGYYDGLIFHRVIPEFMIQGGDPDGRGTGGEVFGANLLKMNSLQKLSIYAELYPWQTLVQTQTAVNSSSFKNQICLLTCLVKWNKLASQ